MRISSLALNPDLLSQMSIVLQPEEREEQNIYIQQPLILREGFNKKIKKKLGNFPYRRKAPPSLYN